MIFNNKHPVTLETASKMLFSLGIKTGFRLSIFGFLIACIMMSSTVYSANNAVATIDYLRISKNKPNRNLLAQNTNTQSTTAAIGSDQIIDQQNSNDSILIFSTGNVVSEKKGQLSVMVVSFDPVIALNINNQRVSLEKYDAYLIEFTISYDKNGEPWTAEIVVETEKKIKSEKFEIGTHQKKIVVEDNLFALLQLGYKQEDNLRHLMNNNDKQTVDSYHALGFLAYTYGAINTLYLDMMLYKDQYKRSAIEESKRPQYDADIDTLELERVSFSIAYRRKNITKNGSADIGYTYAQFRSTAYKKLSLADDTEHKFYLKYRDSFGQWSLNMNVSRLTLDTKYQENTNDERTGITNLIGGELKYALGNLTLTGLYEFKSVNAKGAFINKTEHTIGTGLAYLYSKLLFTYDLTYRQSTFSEVNTEYDVKPKKTKTQHTLALTWLFHTNFNAKLYHERNDHNGNFKTYKYKNNFSGIQLNAFY